MCYGVYDFLVLICILIKYINLKPGKKWKKKSLNGSW